MPLLIDAYNVLHVVGVLPPDLAGIDLPELADLIATSRYRKDSTILVCDGVTKPHRVDAPGVHVRFAGPGVKADDLIIRMVKRSSAPRRVMVVTSDQEIVRTARRRRAVVISSETFLARLSQDQHERPRSDASRHRRSSEHPADRRQVEHWLRIFGITPGDPSLDPPSSPSSTTGPRDSSRPTGDRTKQTPREVPTPPRPNILEAGSLAEIDPRQIEQIDMNHLMSNAERLREGSDDENENPRQ